MIDLIQEFVNGESEIVFRVFMASIVLATLVTGLILSLLTWLGERRHWDDPLEAALHRLNDARRMREPTDRFSLRHLKSWHPIALTVLTAASAASLLFVWHVVVFPLAATALVSYLWHFKLRRSGIKWAAAYSLASWVLPYFVVTVTMVLFSDSLDLIGRIYSDFDAMWLQWYWWSNREDYRYSFAFPRLMDLDPLLLTVVAFWTMGVSVVSLGLARFRRTPLNPSFVAAASCPGALWFWFVNPWAIPLGAFTMVLLGHAMSRERRLRIKELRLLGCARGGVSAKQRSEARPMLRRFTLLAVMAAIAALAVVTLSSEEVVYDWVVIDWKRSQFGDYRWHYVWYDLIRTSVIWMPLIALATVGYLVLRKVSPPMRAVPCVATAILVAVMLDALIQGEWRISSLTWSDLRWSPEWERFVELGHQAFYFGPRLIIGDVTGSPLGLSFGIAAVLLFGFAWQAVRDTLAGYGGLLFGMAWIVVVFWLMEFSVYLSPMNHTVRISLNDFLLANLVIAAVAMFAALYWGFGPGSVRARTPKPDRHAQGAT